MINAHEASRLLREMSPQERLQELQEKVSQSTRDALDKAVRQSIAHYNTRINIILGPEICVDPDKDIANLLKALGYVNIRVTSDFPAYNESYPGKTCIKFALPKRENEATW